MRRIRVGSRDSRLAVIQAEIVIAAIKKYDMPIEIELVTMKTTGDKILDRTLDQIGGKGLFVKELDQALYNGDVDITVHSYKDMPLEDNPQLPVVALSAREDPRDVLILRKDIDEAGLRASELPRARNTGILKDIAPIGSSSLRRRVQLGFLYPGCETAPIRGNVQTRLKKLDDGEFSAVVLAAAGIKRLGLEARISRYFSADEIMPAASQGIIAVQGRRGENFDYLNLFNHEESWGISLAERTFAGALGGGCSSPVAAYALMKGNEIKLAGMYYDHATGEIRKDSICGAREEAAGLGYRLAGRIKQGRQEG